MPIDKVQKIVYNKYNNKTQTQTQNSALNEIHSKQVIHHLAKKANSKIKMKEVE